MPSRRIMGGSNKPSERTYAISPVLVWRLTESAFWVGWLRLAHFLFNRKKDEYEKKTIPVAGNLILLKFVRLWQCE